MHSTLGDLLRLMLTIRRMCLAEAGVLFSSGLGLEKASKRTDGGKDEPVFSSTILLPGKAGYADERSRNKISL